MCRVHFLVVEIILVSPAHLVRIIVMIDLFQNHFASLLVWNLLNRSLRWLLLRLVVVIDWPVKLAIVSGHVVRVVHSWRRGVACWTQNFIRSFPLVYLRMLLVWMWVSVALVFFRSRDVCLWCDIWISIWNLWQAPLVYESTVPGVESWGISLCAWVHRFMPRL